MFTIVGLGNPGDEYENTPHNIGRELVYALGENQLLSCSPWSTQSKSLMSRCSVSARDDSKLTLLLPETFMNVSGEALTNDMKQSPEHIIVVHDDIDLSFGEIRISFNRGSGGHNGVKSIEQSLKTRTFIRLRVGVCPLDWLGRPRKPQGQESVSNYLVRKKLSSRYTSRYESITKELAQRIETIALEGVTRAMNQYN